MSTQPETILVTGGTGFVGAWAIVRLLEQGYNVKTTIRNLKKVNMVRDAVASQVDPGERLTFVQADLTSDAGWTEAMAGVDRMLHVASPMHTDDSADIETFLKPQREGDERVLRFAAAANVKHVVITSAAAAAKPSDDSRADSDETVWTQPNDPVQNPYQRSKAIAEKAAWAWMENYNGDMKLSTVLPTAVFGPVLMPQNDSSQILIEQMIKGHVPGALKINFDIVDVRDLVDLEILAMKSDKSGGQRYLAAAGSMSMHDIAETLKEHLGDHGKKIHTLTIPNWVLSAIARFNANVAVFVGLLGRKFHYTSAKAENDLGWRPRNPHTTITDSADRMVTLHLVD